MRQVIAVTRFGGTKVLIHYGGGSARDQGSWTGLKPHLEASDIPYIELGDAMPNPKCLVYEGIDLCPRKALISFWLSAEVVPSTLPRPSLPVYPMMGTLGFYSKDMIITEALPFGTILTLAAAARSSSSSVITHEDGMLKRSIRNAIRPVFSILNRS